VEVEGENVRFSFRQCRRITKHIIVVSTESQKPLILKRISRREAEMIARVANIAGVVSGTIVTWERHRCLLMPCYRVLTSFARKLSLNERIIMGCACARVLREIHKRGVLHNDLKPDNIFVDKLRQPLIGDFGSASLSEQKTWEFRGTYLFCFHPRAPRSETQDLQSLCLAFVWLAKPWPSQHERPSWSSLQNDEVVMAMCAAYNK